MAQILEDPTSVAQGSTNPIELPTNSEPTKILRTSVVPQIPYSTGGEGDDPTYMVKGSIGDTLPGFLDAKIGTNFSIVGNKITLANLTGFSTTNLTEGTSLYYTQDRFDSAFTAKSTTDLSEGTKLYYTEARVSLNTDVAANTAARHTHSNKTTLDSITEAFTTTLKSTYDGYSSGIVSGATGPITFTSQVIAHSNALGYKHIPDDTGIPLGYVLSKGSSLGTYIWIENTGSGSSVTLDATPTISTTAAVQSAWVKNHNDNALTSKHVTAANLTYINTTIPSHIASATLHLPVYVVGDANKYLQINSSGTGYEWDTVDSSISITGENYISISGTVITASLINIAQINITAGSNISISTNTISAIQREIDNTPSPGETVRSITSGWAYTHANSTGAGSHIPSGGTSAQYIAGDGTAKDFSSASGGIFEIELLTGGPTGSIATRIGAGSVFPSGWSGAVGTVTTDLVITHTAAKAPINISIWANDGTDKTLLVGSAAYSTVIGNTGDTEITIASLATINEAINIYIQFE